MRKPVLILFLAFNVFVSFAQETNEGYIQIVKEFIDCIKHKKKEKLSTMISFPFEREYSLPDIKNKNEFIKRYSEVFDDSLVKIIVNSKPTEDWSEVGWRGIMLLNGIVWLDYDGTLKSVYQSKFERIKRDELIKKEKGTLHESIRKFKQPILVLETSEFRIRIDDLGDWNYRYTSWHKKNKMSDKPDLVIENGEFVPEGSGGDYTYKFKKDDYVYECSIIIIGQDDSPPAMLTISKGEKEILSDKAEIIRK